MTRFPNVLLTTHKDNRVRFYDDLVKNKVVVINFMYTRCAGRCPPTIATVRRLQDALGARAGRDVHFYSITLDPAYDTANVLGAYAASVGAGAGWRFLTGAAVDIELIRRRLGVVDPDPVRDADRSQHSNLLILGNDRVDRWAACPALTGTSRILTLLGRLAGEHMKGSAPPG